jgi:predicted acetyltransferase
VTITLIPAAETERPILRSLMELYLYDFSEFDLADIGPHGLYEYPYLDHYWTDPWRHPFLIRVEERLAGFVLVTRYNYLTGEVDPAQGAAWVIAEFFIMRRYRRQGVGEAVARQVFVRFPGPWQVAQIRENTPATAFWRKVIARYTAGHYQEHQLDDEHWCGPLQIFKSPPEGGPIQETP